MKPLPAVILEASKQSAKVNRLVDYCRELDGTELRVIKLPEHIDAIPHPVGIELGFRYAAEVFDEPWLYMESDSIPLKPGFVNSITEEYYSSGKLFMLPSLDGCAEHDVASAIGVWPGGAHKYLPANPNIPPWFDLHIYKNLKNDTHFTKQILHRYGIYDGERVVRRCEFPRDKKILTKEAVIFHADPTQSIIRGGLFQSYFHSGDFGDIIASLPIIKQQGGGCLILGPHHTYKEGMNPRALMNSYRYKLIQPLLECQPYIKCAEYRKWEESEPDVDLSTFRFKKRNEIDNLGEWQARGVIGRLELDMDPWLEVPDASWTGRVAVSRSLSYHNNLFPWKWIAGRFKDRILFVGLPEEHKAWEELVGIRVERAQTFNLLEVAKVLSGCELHFGNQSLPSWITMGMGKTMIMEVWPPEPNSIVRNCPQSIFAKTPRDMIQIKETF